MTFLIKLVPKCEFSVLDTGATVWLMPLCTKH